MCPSPRLLLRARRGTKPDIERLRHKRIGLEQAAWSARARLGRVDGRVAQELGRRVARRSGDGAVHVAVGTGDDDVEFAAPLACVDCVVGGGGAAPEDAFDVGSGGGVEAVWGVWVDAGVALKVEIEGLAAGDGGAFVGAEGGVEGWEEGVAHVAGGG